MRWPWDVIAEAVNAHARELAIAGQTNTDAAAMSARVSEQATNALEHIASAVHANKPAAEPMLREGERLHGCPKCHSTLPAASVLVLRSWVTRDGVLVGIPTGERVACQAPNCQHQYSLHAGGSWQHSPLAQPMTADPGEQAKPDAMPESARPTGEPPAWPAARTRPNV